MKQRINTIQAVDILLQDDNSNWSLEGAKALVEYLEELEEETGEELEFDVVAIRCDYSEMTYLDVLENYEDIKRDYYEREGEDDADEINKKILFDVIGDYTTVIEVNDYRVIIQDF